MPTFFASAALTAGVIAFLRAGLKGHGAGWEEMLIFSAPAIVCALIAIALRRSAITYAGLAGGALAAVGLVLGW